MKKLILIRHAKSSWEYDVIDHERPLKDRGVNDANLIGNKLKSLQFLTDLVMVSDAIRTKMTSEIILSKLDIDSANIQYKHSLYDFAGNDLVKTIKSCDDSFHTLMVFGHNHAITAFVNTYGDEYIYNVPTCGVVVIDFSQDNWQEISNGKTVLKLFPRDLK